MGAIVLAFVYGVKHSFAKHLFPLRLDRERLFGYICSPYIRSSMPPVAAVDDRRSSWELSMTTSTAFGTPSPIRPHRGPARTRSHRPKPAAAPVGPRARRAQGVPSRRLDGRLFGAASAVLVAAALVAGADLVGAGESADAEAQPPAAGLATVVARPGDTLWSVAAEHRGDVGIRRYLDALIDLNGGPSIQAGQRVVLP